ncbi:MAG: MBG domain-containing protein, partial [Chthoniobacterales bacterium]
VPADANNMQLRFWHSYNLQAAQDGGRLQISTDNGSTWFDTDSSGAGVSFAANGYTTTISARGKPADRSDFQGKSAWSGNSGGFVEVVLNLTDTAKFAGRTVRFRWVLATNASVESAGWYVDSIVLTGGADLVNQPPSITSPAAVPGAGTVTDLATDITYSLVPTATAPLEVAASDDGGSAGLTYTWTATGPGPVFFLPNGGAGSSSTQADFEQLGDYQVNVTVTDPGGLSATSTVYVRVEATASAVRVNPAFASLALGATQQFTAVLLDQFGGEMDSAAVTFNWTATGGGTVDSAGRFTATQAGENFAVVAGTTLPDGSVFSTHASGDPAATAEASDFAQVTVTPGAATVTLGALTQIYDGSPKSVTVTTDPAGIGVSVTYSGSVTAPSAAGNYDVEAVVTDPNYQGGATGTLAIELSAFDAWRQQNFGETWESNPDSGSVFDADGDGVDNHAEFYLGTDPADPGSRLTLSAAPVTSTNATIVIAPAVTSGEYTLKSWSDLTQAPVSIPLEITEDSASVSFEVPADPNRNFFQLLYTPPPLP